jgi:DNA-binding PadR family transcriptional regulator
MSELPRLSPKERNILEQLVGREKYGLELVAGSDGVLSRNAIYVFLGRMEDRGLIVGRNAPTPKGSSGPPRRIYRVTGHGRRLLEVHQMAASMLAVRA